MPLPRPRDSRPAALAFWFDPSSATFRGRPPLGKASPDGNVGIAGEPMRLLRRTRLLFREGGCALLETEPAGEGTLTLLVRIDAGGRVTEPFPWAQVGADDLPALASEAGLELAEQWTDSGRWFARVVAR